MFRILLVTAASTVLSPGAFGQTLTVSGACPGTLDLAATGFAPGESLVVLSGNDVGNAALPAGPCAGVETGLSSSGFALRATTTANAYGEWSMSPTLPAGVCSSQLQVVSSASCGVMTNTASLSDTPAGPCDWEDFEDGMWPAPGWTAATYLTGGSITNSIVHGGNFAVMDPDWHYDDSSVRVGDTLSAWVNTTGGGRIYLGFDSDASGTKSFVLAPNSGDIRFQGNPAYDYIEMNSLSMAIPTGEWVRMEVQLRDSVTAVGRLYDGDGLLLGEVTDVYSTPFGGGGVALRGFGDTVIDDVELVCAP